MTAHHLEQTTITFYRLDYLPRDKQKAGFSPYRETKLGAITIDRDLYCAEIDELCLDHARKSGANRFAASTPNEGVWYCGGIF